MLTEPLVVARTLVNSTVPRLPAVPMVYEFAGLPVPVLSIQTLANLTVPPVAACGVTSRPILISWPDANVDVPDVLAPPKIAN